MLPLKYTANCQYILNTYPIVIDGGGGGGGINIK